IRTGVRNVIDNINTPTVAMNDLLQGRPHNFVDSTGRFLLNSTVGIGGIFDVAAKIGVAKHQADFGQTLGRWGLSPGPYIYVPVLGPTDLRDGVGRIVDSFANILEIHALHVGPWERVGVAAVDGIDTRASLDSSIEDLNRTATDPYVAIRSIYTQNRQSMITDTATAVDQLPSFDAPPPGAAPASHP
ncbi:MAG: VacJ family lipoprotein, partial [Caulobacteraceae bacterium]|nr:VacJ family lipoprotein [Caulobacteraceae bacterium]